MGARLYIGNLSFDTTEDTLRDALSADGRNVKDVHIMTDRDTGRPRGFAFAEMGSEQDAQAAIQALDGLNLDGRNLTGQRGPGAATAAPVAAATAGSPTPSSKQRAAGGTPVARSVPHPLSHPKPSPLKRHLYVGNLPKDYTEAELRDLFAQDERTVESVTIRKTARTGHSRGFGFVTMENEEDAERAARALNGTEIRGKALRIGEAYRETRDRPVTSSYEVRGSPEPPPQAPLSARSRGLPPTPTHPNRSEVTIGSIVTPVVREAQARAREATQARREARAAPDPQRREADRERERRLDPGEGTARADAGDARPPG